MPYESVWARGILLWHVSYYSLHLFPGDVNFQSIKVEVGVVQLGPIEGDLVQMPCAQELFKMPSNFFSLLLT
jgi:hypothetical protein